MNQQSGVSFAPVPGGAPSTAIGNPTPVPIHDIVGPLPFFSGPLWIIAAVFLGVALAGVWLWLFVGRKKINLPTPDEAALAALLRLRERVSEGGDHDFGVGVSDVLRKFLGEALGLAAPRQTTEEFLTSLRGSLRFLPAEQESLTLFLHHADYLKYARGEATREQRLALIEAAESFVLSGREKVAAPSQGWNDKLPDATIPPALPQEILSKSSEKEEV